MGLGYVRALARFLLYAPRFEAESCLQRCRDSVVGAWNRQQYRDFYPDQRTVVAAVAGRASRTTRADFARAARQQTAVVVRSADRLGSLVFRFLSGKYWSGADWLSIKTFFNISFTIASSPSHSRHPD